MTPAAARAGPEEGGRTPEAWVAEAAQLARALPASIAPLFDASFLCSNQLWEEFVACLVIRIFRAAGLESAIGDGASAAEATARAGLDPGSASVPLGWMLRALARRGVLRETDHAGAEPRYRMAGSLPDPEPEELKGLQRRHDPSWLPSYALVETVARDYPAFLRGEISGQDVLFSPARLTLWLDFFSNGNGLYAVNNRVGAVALADWLPRAGARLLELGGGLGSGTAAALERLAASGRLPEIQQYRFTELVPAFLRRGQRALASACPGGPPLAFERLDMNQPFEAQGVEEGSVSVVYAVNALHVAHDLGFTLAEIRRALEPGGRLVISECVRPVAGWPMYPEFVFNLMEAFRAPRLHPEYRPNGGFLTPEQWAAAMRAGGLTDVRFLPDLPALRDRFPRLNVAAIGASRPA